MKKVYFILMMVAAVNLASCGGGDDEGITNGGNSQNNPYSNDVVGTWKGYSCADGDPNDLSKNHSLTLAFNSDGSGNYLEIDNSYTDKCDFTYSMESGTKGKAYIETRGNTIYFVIEGNKMFVYGHGYGEDLDFLLNKQ